MKTLFIKMFFVLFLLNNLSQAQNWIKDYDGIAIDAGLDYDWVTYNPYAVDSMRKAGVNVIHLSIENHSQISTLTSPSNQYPHNYRFQVLPFKSVDVSGNSYDWIQYYSDAKYTKWEAEGTPISEGKATLEPNLSKAKDNGTFITRKGNVPNSIDTLIKGPYYRQDVKYYTGNCDTVIYRADFRMKLEMNNNVPPVEDNPEDTICIIQVTQSDISNYSTTPWTIGGTHIIQQRIIKRLHFEQLNQFDTFSFSYKLRYDSSQSTSPVNIEEFRTVFVDPPCDYLIRGRNYIQFKVIWKGKSNLEGFPQYLLSIDNIVVYDERGAQIKENFMFVKALIEQQDKSILDYHNSVTGWIGIDEPRSIDQYEPIKIVTQILNDLSQGGKRTLYIPFAGTWDGAWNNSSPNNYGAMKLNPLIEFKKRVGNANIIHSSYLFDIPCSENSPPSNTACWTGEDQRSINIWRHAKLNYKYLYDIDPNFGVSIQCGAIKPPHGPTSQQRNIARKEFLYTANLALMYGAKFLSLYTYFAQAPLEDSSTTILTYHAIVDYHKNTQLQGTVYTDKYFTLKDTLAPRLSGLFGKTLKKLIPFADSLGKNPSTSYSLNFNRIKKVKLANYNGSEAVNSLIEIGT